MSYMIHLHWGHLLVGLAVLLGAALAVLALIFAVGLILALVRGRPSSPAKATPKPSAGGSSRIDAEELAAAVVKRWRQDAPSAGALPTHPLISAAVEAVQKSQDRANRLAQTDKIADQLKTLAREQAEQAEQASAAPTA